MYTYKKQRVVVVKKARSTGVRIARAARAASKASKVVVKKARSTGVRIAREKQWREQRVKRVKRVKQHRNRSKTHVLKRTERDTCSLSLSFTLSPSLFHTHTHREVRRQNEITRERVRE